MTKIANSAETDQETLDYKYRVQRAKEQLDKLPYGSQAQMGFDIRVTSTIVSAIFAGRYVSSEMLSFIEGWLKDPSIARDEAMARSDGLLTKIEKVLVPS